ncbi:MAG: hypothetical protein R2941_05180 [Desulfobacterales bacterium]
MFPEDYMLGVDLVIPDMDYIRRNKSRVARIVLTHALRTISDSALPSALRRINVPVYGTPFTMGVVRHKLEEHGFLFPFDLREIRPGQRHLLSVTSMDIIRVGHSVVDGIAVAIHYTYGAGDSRGTKSVTRPLMTC